MYTVYGRLDVPSCSRSCPTSTADTCGKTPACRPSARFTLAGSGAEECTVSDASSPAAAVPA